jgi:transcriptional regulator with XRE-family HTH domain
MAPADEGVRRIGENVRAARHYRGMSLETLAGLTGRSKGWLSKIENGHARLERRSDVAALAEALQVAADDLLGEPARGIQPAMRTYNLVPLRDLLLDFSLGDPPDVPSRPVEVLRSQAVNLDQALRVADYATMASVLPGLLGELHVMAASGAEPDRTEALRLVIQVCALATCMLRHFGQTDLAWISADRGQRAAGLLGDPLWSAAAAYGRAHARSAANKSRSLLATPRIADELQPQVGDDRFAHEVHGMLRLSAALACEVQGDHAGARDQAREAAQLARRLGDRPDSWELFGPSNVAVWRTSLAVEAGDPAAALSHADEVDPLALASKNRRGALAMEKARHSSCSGTTHRPSRSFEGPSGCHPYRHAIIR